MARWYKCSKCGDSYWSGAKAGMCPFCGARGVAKVLNIPPAFRTTTHLSKGDVCPDCGKEYKDVYQEGCQLCDRAVCDECLYSFSPTICNKCAERAPDLVVWPSNMERKKDDV